MSQVSYHYRLLSTGPLPVWLGLLLLVAAVAAALWLLQREHRGRRGRARSRWLYITRAAVATILAVLVMQPVLFIRRDETRPALLLVVVDRSRSMLRSDPYEGSRLLNLAAPLGTADLRGRDDLPERVRHELVAWQKDLEEWQARVSRTYDELSQGIPPGPAFEQVARAAAKQLGSINAKLGDDCGELAKLSVRWSPASATNGVAEVKGPDAQWFLAPSQLLDQLGRLEQELRGVGGANLSEDKALNLLRAQDAVLADLKTATAALTSLQTYGDERFEKTLSAEARAALQQLAANSRFTLATQVLGAMTNRTDLAGQHTFRFIGTSPLDTGSADGHTDLYQVVKQAAASVGQQTVAGVVLASDGQQNLPERPELMRELAGRGIPFIAAGVGRPETLPDVAIVNYDLPTTLLAGDRATVTANLKTAVPKDTEVTLSLSLKGNALAARQWKTADVETRISLDFVVPPNADAPLVLAAKTPQPDGAPNNDQVEIGVTVLPEPARILVIAPAARWDIVCLLQALARKPWRVDTVFWEKGEQEDAEKADPSEITQRLAQLKTYQLLILDGQPFEGITNEDVGRLQEYVVKDGGSVLVIASEQGSWYGDTLASLLGATPTALPAEDSARLLPAAEAANYPLISLAADAAESLARWQRLAPPQRVRAVPLQMVPLLTSHQQVCLSLGFHGRGKIYALGCGDLFRLREWMGGPAVNRFLANVIDDALEPAFPKPDRRLAIYPAMPRAGSRAHVLLDAEVDQPAPAGKAMLGDGTGRALQFQRRGPLYEAALQLDQAGPVTLEITGHEKFTFPCLASVSMEDVNFGLNMERLQHLADLAGGAAVPLAELPGRLTDLPPRQDVTTTMRVIRLWNLWFLLPALAALMTTDWVLRRQEGLVL